GNEIAEVPEIHINNVCISLLTYIGPAHAIALAWTRFTRSERQHMASEATFLMQQFLAWVDARPRRHAEVRDAWSSTCPLNCAWEDALADDLVRFDAAGHLVLSERGR